MKMTVHKLVDRFSPHATGLRKHFDKQFKDPLHTHAGRFVWDYWHVPHEYTVLRTPAFHYFPRPLYEKFHRHLVQWGRMNLGCHDVSPPWLSCYVEGCRQEEHVDRPHGPLAFVFSLTKWQTRKFRGGETFLNTRPRQLLQPEFNRLTLFNPAIPHGVREVRGTHDPREARLVINGWFVQPRPFWVGPLKVEEVQEGVEEGLERVLAGGLELGRGLLSLRIAISASGRVGQVRPLMSTLIGAQSADVHELLTQLKTLKFPKKAHKTALTLPLICD